MGSIIVWLTRRRSLISVVKQFTRKMSKTSRRTLSSFSSNKDFAANDFSFAAIFFSVLQSSLNYIMIKGNILRKVKISINRGKKNHKLFDRKGKLSLDGDCTDLVHVLLSFIKKI